MEVASAQKPSSPSALELKVIGKRENYAVSRDRRTQTLGRRKRVRPTHFLLRPSGFVDEAISRFNLMTTEHIAPFVDNWQWAETAQPQDILRWATQTYGSKLTMATALGAEGCVLIDMLAKLRDETGLFPDIFNLDTGYQFPQTLGLLSRVERKYGITIRRITPDAGIDEAEARSQSEFGLPLHKSDPNACCHFRKVVPLRPALEGFDAWITAIRRDQTAARAQTAIIGSDKQFPLVKINPLANWTSQQVWDYIRAHDVPFNPLHDAGFPSIGCYPCTRPVAAGEDERAGRWANSEKKECGLHLDLTGKITTRARPF